MRNAGKKILFTIFLAVLFGLISGLIFTGFVEYRWKKTEEKMNLACEEAKEADDDVISDRIDEIVTQELEIEEKEGTVSSVALSAMPSVVAITSVSIQEIPSFFGYGFGYSVREYPSTGSGSGIIVGENEEELLIATNNHVIDGAKTISVCFIGNDVTDAEEETIRNASGDGDINLEHAVTAKVKGTDADNDLAVIAVRKSDIPEETMEAIRIAALGSSDDLIVGEQVVAIGNSLGYGQSVTSGWISALNRTLVTDNNATVEVIQTDAAINPGNSGGALLNMKGQVIGINSAKYANASVEGMGYSIPISKALPILEKLMNRKTRDIVDGERAAYMGVQIADLSAATRAMYRLPEGAFLIEVAPEGAAGIAGIRKGDIITELDGQKIDGKDALSRLLMYYEAGEEVEVVVQRIVNEEYQKLSFTITFGSYS